MNKETWIARTGARLMRAGASRKAKEAISWAAGLIYLTGCLLVLWSLRK